MNILFKCRAKHSTRFLRNSKKKSFSDQVTILPLTRIYIRVEYLCNLNAIGRCKDFQQMAEMHYSAIRNDYSLPQSLSLAKGYSVMCYKYPQYFRSFKTLWKYTRNERDRWKCKPLMCIYTLSNHLLRQTCLFGALWAFFFSGSTVTKEIIPSDLVSGDAVIINN